MFRNYDWCDFSYEKRTPESHPYTYDAFFVFGGNDVRKAQKAGQDIQTAYHDRMMQWDVKAWNRACGKSGGRAPHRYMNKKQAQQFLSAYYEDKPVEIIALAEGCNQSSGYPYWIFYWKSAN